MSEQLQIEAGKFYKDGKGRKISVEPWNGDSEKVYLWQGKDGPSFYYTADGRVYPDTRTNDDLISEWPPESEQPGVDPGEGWRLLKDGELVERGDELYYHKSNEWCSGVWAGIRVKDGLVYRRRIAPASVESVPQVDIVRHEVEQLRRANAELLQENCEMRGELHMYKELHRQALRCVDRVFQEGEDGQPAILPNYCKLGQNKFQAVITLADEFVELQAELDRHKESLGFALQNNEKLKEELRKEQQRCDHYQAQLASKPEAVEVQEERAAFRRTIQELAAEGLRVLKGGSRD